MLHFAVDEVVPRLARTTDEIDMALHALDGGYVPAGPSGSPLRGLVNVLPTGRNFYSVDPRAVPSRLAWETGQGLADSLVERYVAETGGFPASVGLSVWGTSAMRTSGDDVAQVLALLGVRPVWDEASRRVTTLEAIPLTELERPRIDVVVRISGFFRDAFPHVVTMLDDAVTLAAGLDEGPEQNFVRAHVDADVAEHGDRRRATTRVFGSKPGAYGAGLLSLIDSRDWRTDADLAEVYAVWGGYAYGRDLDGVAARPDMETAYRRIAVAAKNIDTREHDIADSDDYFQYHGGMVATVRALTGSSPKAYIGDSTRPEHVRTRSLVEETSRVFRARVVNPKWIAAMRRHGYKGAFEMAATVDYLFGYDATTGVVADWMYEKLTQSYVLDPENRAFLEESNPWALHGIAERLLEAADRAAVGRARPAAAGRAEAGLPGDRGRPRSRTPHPRREDPVTRPRTALLALPAAAVLLAGCGSDDADAGAAAPSARGHLRRGRPHRPGAVGLDRPGCRARGAGHRELPPCGLVVADVVVGDGAVAEPGTAVEVRYVGRLLRLRRGVRRLVGPRCRPDAALHRRRRPGDRGLRRGCAGHGRRRAPLDHHPQRPGLRARRPGPDPRRGHPGLRRRPGLRRLGR